MLRDLKQSIKQDRGIEVSQKALECLKTLLRYYSPRCKFTTDQAYLSEIF